MKVYEILTEGANRKVILVDFQPAYDNGVSHNYKDALSNAMEDLSRIKPHDILAFYNGPELGFDDTDESVLQHFYEYGLDEDVGYNITFRDKVYNFFRSWMDEGIDTGIIIKVIRHLLMIRSNDSRDIPEEDMIELIGETEYNDTKDIIESDPLSIPDIAIDELKTYSGALKGGGGRDECMREIQILMSAFNIKYKMVENWTY